MTVTQNKTKRTESGFSLIEILVATGILGVISLGIMQVISRAIEGQRAAVQRQAALTIQQNMVGLLADRSMCQLNFQGINTAAPVVIPTIVTSKAPLVTVLQTGATYESQSVRLTQMRLENFRAYGTAGDDRYRGTIELRLTLAPATNTFSSVTMVRTLLLMTELQGYKNAAAPNPTFVNTCVAVGGDLNSIWTLKANGDIYYEGFNVGIGTTAPTQKLQVNGDVWATAYLLTSDARLKTKVRPAPGLEAIRRIDGIAFKWKDSKREALGVAAQNVESVLPSAVFTDPTSGYKSVSYNQLIGPLIESVKELSRENQKLESRIQRLEKRSRDQ